MRIGVLALQGDFAKHAEMLHYLGVEVQEIRKPEDLLNCDGLIIPGGESTVMMRQIDFINLRDPLLNFAQQKPVFGTCAGLILMSKKASPSSFQPLNLLDIEVERNAFGRQIDSFQSPIKLDLPGEEGKYFPAFFIRAPRIKQWGKEVQVLGTFKEEPIFIRQGHFLAATFHPELTSDSKIHQFFLEIVRNSIELKRDV